MLNVILTSILSFVSTNIDDILVLTLFFGQCRTPRDRLQIALGQYIGIGCLTALSLLGAYGLQLLPQQYLNLLGLLPLALGAKELVSYRRNRQKQDPDDHLPTTLGFLQVALVTIANGGDNIGVYIPLFAGFSPRQATCAVIVFAIMVALWCLLAASLTRLPFIKTMIQKYKHILVPTVLIALGLYILISF